MSYGMSVLLPYAISYFLFFGLLCFSWMRNSNRLFNSNGFTQNLSLLLGLHLAGIFLFGILPFFSNHYSAVALYDSTGILKWPSLIVILALVILLVVSPRLVEKEYRSSAAGGFASAIPASSFLLTYFVTRGIFIVSYEIWFRGFLLNDSIARFGIPISLLLNVALYTLLHIVNGRKEVVGCVPFGLLLCFLCIWQGAAWPAAAIHLTLTLSYEIIMTNRLMTKSPAL